MERCVHGTTPIEACKHCRRVKRSQPDEQPASAPVESPSDGSVSEKLESLGGRKVDGEQLERITSALKAGQNAALEAMEKRLSREKPNDRSDRHGK